MISKYNIELLILRSEILQSEIYYMQHLILEDGMELSKGGYTIIYFTLILSVI
jgi:hypothetical protein